VVVFPVRQDLSLSTVAGRFLLSPYEELLPFFSTREKNGSIGIVGRSANSTVEFVDISKSVASSSLAITWAGCNVADMIGSPQIAQYLAVSGSGSSHAGQYLADMSGFPLASQNAHKSPYIESLRDKLTSVNSS
jgi:hypothetical protein